MQFSFDTNLNKIALKFFIALAFLLAFAVCGAAQKAKTPKKLDSLDLINMNNQSENLELGFVTPNELEGYEFFKKGKLNNVRLGVSTKADIENIFGSDCKKPCDYSSNWTITFDYFSETLFVVEEKYNKNLNKSVEKNYIPKKEVVGKISSVWVRPKKRISFENVIFSGQFKKHSYLESGYLRSEAKEGVLIDFYVDIYGLQYLVFDKFTSHTFKDTFNLRKQFENFRKGDLITIKYTIPEGIENSLFVEVK
ncbi:MAG TPA: hypothetical protein VK308_10555 [Pyrinomonadaceae bacterium]|nr:hypothetical protein [Pyrinomonadaceae bacterium]